MVPNRLGIVLHLVRFETVSVDPQHRGVYGGTQTAGRSRSVQTTSRVTPQNTPTPP